MIISFECDVSDKLKSSIDNYLRPKNPLLELTNDLFVENEAYYFGRMVLIIERGLFDIISRYVVYFGVMGLILYALSGVYIFSFILYISLILIAAGLSYLLPIVRFYLLRWRIHKVVDKDLVMCWLSKEQVVSRFVSEVYAHGSE